MLSCNLKKKFLLNSGFSLVEILVVISILALLSTMVITALNTARQKAKIAQASIVVNQLNIAIELLADDTEFWPGREAAAGSPSPQQVGVTACANGDNNEVQDLGDPQAGLTADSGDYPGWNGPYISEVPLDPWGNKYFFDTDYDIGDFDDREQAVAVGSYGPNGVGNNLYDEDDIINVLVVQVCP
ncbi:MAG: type II secretion system protein GspG [bacterium]|nr:type II secretion system protein GspG [bacterium]